MVNLRFAEMPSIAASEPGGILAMFQFTKDDIMRGVELLVMMLLGIVVVLVVVRPLVRRIIEPEKVVAPITPPAIFASAASTATSEPAAAQASRMIEFAKI